MSADTATPAASVGHTLIELLVVLALLGLCAVVGAHGVVRAVEINEARVSAQAWQTAAAAAQSRALWGGASTRVGAGTDGLYLRTIAADANDGSHILGPLQTPPSVNVTRWRIGSGSVVTFAAGSAAPDSGGSLTFGSSGWAVRVVVRVESGLTGRSRP